MQIKAIILYNKLGDKQIIPFKVGAVNIIQGKEDTGKSAIIPIIEYCLGRSEFEVPGDIIRTTVAWYAVWYQFDETQVFIAKQAPGKNNYRNQVFYMQDSNIVIPEINELIPNSDDYLIKQKILELLHKSSKALNDSVLRNYIETTIDKAIFYLFQDQGTITNPKLLFHRQDNSIAITLPYFLEVVDEEYSKLQKDLAEAQNESDRYKRQLKNREEFNTKTINEGKNLIEEAKRVGLIESERFPENHQEIIELLKRALQTPDEPETLPFPRLVDDDRIPQLDEEIKALIQKDQEYDDEINTIKIYAQEEKEYANAVDENIARLESINLFEEHPDWLESSNICPFCFSSLQPPLPKSDSLRNALKQLQENLNITTRNKPRLEHSVERLKKEQKNIRQQLRQKRALLDEILKERSKKQDIIEQILNTNTHQLKVRNRIEYYLEHVGVSDNLILQNQIEDVERHIKEYRHQIELYPIKANLNSILSDINSQMTKWAERLDILHREGSKYQFDLDKLTVFFGEGREMTPMQRMGGHKKVLGCHLMLYLALHKYFIKNQRPVPHFLILDQPAQGYFPSPDAYKKAMDDAAIHISDNDFAAVERMFGFLFDICEELSPHFQLIILEHANLPDQRFQQALIKGCPWTGIEKNALIPQNWIPTHLREIQHNIITRQLALDDLQ